MAYPDHRWAQSNLKKYESFHDFIISLEDAEVRRLIKRYIHFRDQIEWISSPGKDRKILMNFVGRYERFQDDYTEICNLLGLSPPIMPSERKSTHGQDYRAVYTSKMVDIVGNICKSDITAFGYEFE